MEELEMTAMADTSASEEESLEAAKTNSEYEEEVPSEVPEERSGEEDENPHVTVDYGELAKADMEELRSLFPNLRDKTSITELDNPLRYAALRDLGLSPKEAYLATSEPHQRYDNRSHLKSSVPRSASAPTDILTRGELEAARELFSGLSDREIQKLYKRVSR